MPEVWIVVDAEVDATGELAASSGTTTMVAALKQSIANDSATITTVRVLSKSTLHSADGMVQGLDSQEVILCPLTLDIPTSFPEQNRRVYQACHLAIALRYLVEQKFGYATNSGSYWLPIVLTQKGPLYAEAIGLSSELSQELPTEDLSLSSFSYYQPVHLSDSLRQPLYELGHRLLKFLEAPPATYLLQFGFKGKNIWFDRLWPFPAAPAIASVNVQSPDLFTCHWRCLTGLPIIDLTIIPKTC